MKTALFIYLSLYVAALILISWVISRKEGDEGFLIANRDRKWWIIASSQFAGAIGVGYFVAYTGYAYEYGFGVYLILLGSVIGYSLFGLWAAARLYKDSREQAFYTQGDYVKFATKSEISKHTVNIVANIILFGWLLIGVVGGAKIISYFGLMSYEFALLATVLVVMSYILIAGFKAVLATDVFQSFIILILVALLVWVVTNSNGVNLGEILDAQTGKVDIATAIGFLIFGILSVFSLPNFYQLVYAGKDKKEVRRGITTSIIPIVFVATLLLMVGMYMFTISPGLDSGLVFLEALRLNLPSYLLPFGILLFFAGLMSSADTNIYSISSHYVLSRNSKRPVHDIRTATVILCILSIIVGFFFRDLIDITIVVAALNIILSPAMIYLIAGGKNSYRFMGSIVGGIIGLILGLIFIGIEPVLILPILFGNLIGLIYNGWFIKRKEESVLMSPELN